MYTKLTCMRIPYGEVICVYGKAHVTTVKVIFRLEIIKLSLYKECYVLILLHVIIIKSNKWTDIEYNINYIKVFK